MQKSFVSRYNIDRFVEKTRAVYEGIDRVKKPLKPLLLIFFAFAFYQLLLSPEEQDKAVTIEHEAKAATLPDELHPTVAEKAAILIERAEAKGISIVITDDYRSHEEQDKLYAQGRQNSGEIVTYAQGGESYHNYGLAIDFALQLESGEVIWDLDYDGNGNGQSDWLEVADIAKELGFEWGGDWHHFKDTLIYKWILA